MAEIFVGICDICATPATVVGSKVDTSRQRNQYLYVCVPCSRRHAAKRKQRRLIRVVDTERWEYVKLTGLWLAVLGMLVGAGGCDDDAAQAIPSPTLLVLSALVALAFASQLKPRP